MAGTLPTHCGVDDTYAGTELGVQTASLSSDKSRAFCATYHACVYYPSGLEIPAKKPLYARDPLAMVRDLPGLALAAAWPMSQPPGSIIACAISGLLNGATLRRVARNSARGGQALRARIPAHQAGRGRAPYDNIPPSQARGNWEEIAPNRRVAPGGSYIWRKGKSTSPAQFLNPL